MCIVRRKVVGWVQGIENEFETEIHHPRNPSERLMMDIEMEGNLMGYGAA